MPGTADVSGNSCVLAMLVGDTPGTSSARSRKLRPFIGSAATSVSGTVEAIWLRAASRTGASAETSTVVVESRDGEREGQLVSAADARDREVAATTSLKPDSAGHDVVGADAEVRKAKPAVLIRDGGGGDIGLERALR